jgi:hypothetical protein
MTMVVLVNDFELWVINWIEHRNCQLLMNRYENFGTGKGGNLFFSDFKAWFSTDNEHFVP